MPDTARLRPVARRTAGVLALALLGACAAGSPGPSASPTPSPTSSPTPSPTPSASPTAQAATIEVSPNAQAYLVALDGYAYEALPPTVEQQMAASFASNAAVAAALKGYAATSVTSGGSTVAVVLVLELDPSLTSIPAMIDGFWGGAAGSLNATATKATLAGQEVREIDAATSKVVGWQASSLIVMVFGQEMVPTSGVAEALIKAHA